MSEVNAKPGGMPWVSPYLVVEDVEEAVSFYEKAFGLIPGIVYGSSGKKPFYGELRYRNTLIMVGLPEEGKHHPHKRDLAMTLYCYCDDVEALQERAKEAGAVVVHPLEEHFWGDRTCTLEDPDGHTWMWATHVKDVDA